MNDIHTISVSVNGTSYERTVEARMLLSDFLRHELRLTGTHVGCERGSCGVCTILLDGQAVRSCLMFAVQAQGHEITTIEALTPEWRSDSDPEEMHPIQVAFREKHGLQCGFCTPGFILTLVPFLAENPNPTEAEIRQVLSGNLCRCTGYQGIIESAKLAAKMMRVG